MCNNYNLCEKCEDENLISEFHSHFFIKIRNELKNNDDIIENNKKNYNQNNN